MARRRSFGDSPTAWSSAAWRAGAAHPGRAGRDRADDLLHRRPLAHASRRRLLAALVRGAVRSAAKSRADPPRRAQQRSRSRPARPLFGVAAAARWRRSACRAAAARPARVADELLHVAAGAARPRLRPGGADVLHPVGFRPSLELHHRRPPDRDRALHPAHHDGSLSQLDPGAARCLAQPRRRAGSTPPPRHPAADRARHRRRRVPRLHGLDRQRAGVALPLDGADRHAADPDVGHDGIDARRPGRRRVRRA